MTPEFVIRSFSNDQYYLDKIVYSNFYCIKGFAQNNGPVVVDIGAHCGYFSFLALSLGASRIYSVEPFLENYKMLFKNLFGVLRLGKIIPHQLAIYPNYYNSLLNFKYPIPSDKGIFDFANIEIAAQNDSNINSYIIPSIQLDTYLNKVVKEPVDILKISTGYAETSILTESELVNVKNVCGETEFDKNGQERFKLEMLKKGFIDSKFSTVQGEENKTLFHFSKRKLEDVFAIK